MGKDREGRFIPPKGKPSGNEREEDDLGLRQGMEPDELKEDQEITQKYTSDDKKPAPRVRVMHPNRNVVKGEEEEMVERNKAQNSYKNRYDTPLPGNSATAEALPADLSKDDFAALADYTADWCVTLVIPAHRAGMEVNELQDVVQFKNVLQETEQELQQKGMPLDEMETMLQPGFLLVRDDAFWREQLNGLAVFIAPGVFKYMKLPYPVEARTYIQKTFDLSCLLPILTNDEHFFVLTLSKRKAVLYEADIWGMREVLAKEILMGIDDMVRSEEKEGQSLPVNEISGDKENTDFHGTGTGKPTDRSNISMFMDEVDEVMWKEVLSTQYVPLLLAGPEQLLPVYTHRSRYQHIAQATLPGNQEPVDMQELHERARELLRPERETRLKKALGRYFDGIATPVTSSMPEEVIPACYYSRADILFIQKGYRLPGVFDEMNNKLELHATMEDGDICMVNAAAVKAYLNAAEVFLLDKEQMPNGAEIAAVMRY